MTDKNLPTNKSLEAKRSAKLISDKQKEYIVREVATGRTAKSVAVELGFKHSLIFDTCEIDTVFRDRINRARVSGVDALVDDLQTVAENEPDVQRARLQCDNIKWIASKLQPNKYGDRIDVNVTNSIDLNQAMIEARKRMMEKMPQAIDITPQLDTEADSDEGIFS